jgi:large subunit ribosomal protein L4
MPNVAIYNMQHEQVGEIDLPDAIFAQGQYDHLLHEVVRYQRARKRSGSACTKGRSDVSGGGAKPFRQKGTGRARQGTRRAPQMRGGGVVFGPTPRDYGFKLNKKVRANALKSALSRRVADQKVVLIDELAMPEVKTRHFADFLSRFDVGSALVVIHDNDEAVELSARNIPRVKVMKSDGLNVYDVLGHDHLSLTVPAAEAVKERLS